MRRRGNPLVKTLNPVEDAARPGIRRQRFGNLSQLGQTKIVASRTAGIHGLAHFGGVHQASPCGRGARPGRSAAAAHSGSKSLDRNRFFALDNRLITVPTGSSNEDAAHKSVPEIRSILIASGIPASGIVVTQLPQFTPTQLVPVVLEYPKINASAGPCGRWRTDLGPAAGLDYMTNDPYWNLGCASQHNLAAMVDEPVDIVQPRAEIPPYAPRRDMVFDKYRKGESPATVYPDADKAKISEIGK